VATRPSQSKEPEPSWLSILLRCDTRAPRVALVAAATLWAVFLILPGTTFSLPRYALMEAVASEQAWGVAWASYAGLAAAALAARQDPPLLAFLGLLLFSSTALLLFIEQVLPVPAAQACNITMALLSVWLFVRASHHDE
jgi:hypothetical protein